METGGVQRRAFGSGRYDVWIGGSPPVADDDAREPAVARTHRRAVERIRLISIIHAPGG